MNEMQRLMKEYSNAALERSQQRVIQMQVRSILDRLTLAITPEDGWPGKNEAERALSRERALSKEKNVVEMRAALEKVEADLIGLDGCLDMLLKSMDVLRWMIRNQANVLAGGQDMLPELVEEATPAEVADDQTQEQTEE